MKFGIDCGHNCYPDIGCQGIELEDSLTRSVGKQVMAKLIADGYEVVECLPKNAFTVLDSLARRCAIANDAECSIYVSIHFNSFNSKAYGSEIFAIGAEGKKAARLVLDEISKLGFYSRGVKDGSHLYVLKYTAMPAILIECCFCDSKKDMRLFSVETMSDAIVEGLTKYAKSKIDDSPS